MAALLGGLNEAKKVLRKTETKGGVIDLEKMLNSEPHPDLADVTRDYFFQASIENWYSSLTAHTFRSSFITISTDEAKIIINHWNSRAYMLNDRPQIPNSLSDLVSRINNAIESSFPSTEGVFVKLGTRSPKDSKTVVKKAAAAYRTRLDESGNIQNASTAQHNAKLVALSEEMLKANAVRTGEEAVTLLLDSWRVAEDLMYAVEEEGKRDFSVSLVIRAWDSRIVPQCEFRGFVWDRKLNCIGQYWHSLYYPELIGIKDQVASDCLEFFELLKDSLPVPNAMLDLAWLGPGQVILIEVNPLMEGLGSFKGSTGLFDYYADEAVLTGRAPFEIRIRTEEEDMSSLIAHMSMEWRTIAFGF